MWSGSPEPLRREAPRLYSFSTEIRAAVTAQRYALSGSGDPLHMKESETPTKEDFTALSRNQVTGQGVALQNCRGNFLLESEQRVTMLRREFHIEAGTIRAQLSGRGKIPAAGRLHICFIRHAGTEKTRNQDVAYRLRFTADPECRQVRLAGLCGTGSRIDQRAGGSGGANTGKGKSFFYSNGPRQRRLHPRPDGDFGDPLGSPGFGPADARSIREIIAGGFLTGVSTQSSNGLQACFSQ
jgi:hypothetical protein